MLDVLQRCWATTLLQYVHLSASAYWSSCHFLLISMALKIGMNGEVIRWWLVMKMLRSGNDYQNGWFEQPSRRISISPKVPWEDFDRWSVAGGVFSVFSRSFELAQLAPNVLILSEVGDISDIPVVAIAAASAETGPDRMVPGQQHMPPMAGKQTPTEMFNAHSAQGYGT